MRPVLSLMLALFVAACAAGPGVPPQPVTTLPSGYLLGAGDPTRGAILQASFAFARPARLHGRPDQAARAVMSLEHIAVAVPNDQTYRAFSPLVGVQLAQGRDEVRGLLGIAPDAPPQAVIDALSASAEALRGGDQAAAARALPRAVAPDPARTLAMLDRMPPAPVAARATTAADAALRALDQSDDDGILRLGGR
jgi:hypothetical protein